MTTTLTCVHCGKPIREVPATPPTTGSSWEHADGTGYACRDENGLPTLDAAEPPTTYDVSIPRRLGHDAGTVRAARLFAAVPGRVPEVIGKRTVTVSMAGPAGPMRITAYDGRMFETHGGWGQTAHEWIASAREVPVDGDGNYPASDPANTPDVEA